MAFSSFLQNIINVKTSGEAFVNAIQGKGGTFPLLQGDIKRAVTSIDEFLWKENPGYGFSVVSKTDISSPFGGFSTFRFQINPSSLRQDEDFSVVARATQTGVVVEHEGFVFKRVTLSGTTGIAPTRGLPGVSQDGRSSFGGRSGYHEFGLLINYIRAYAEMKNNPNNENARLVFKNFKDNEFWFVEPLKFTKQRDASRPHLYNYEITMLIIGKAEPPSLGSFFDDLLNIGDFLEERVLGPMRLFRQAMGDGANLIRQAEKEFVSVLFQPIDEAILSLNAVKQGVRTVVDLPRSLFVDIKNNLHRVGDNLSDLFGLGDTQYDATFGRQATIKNPKPPFIGKSARILLKAFLDMEQAFDKVIATNELFEEKVTSKYATIETNFGGAVSLDEPDFVEEVIIDQGMTLEKIAAQFLGTSDRMLELVALNNLKAPYIDVTGTSFDPRVLKPGDTILVPLANGGGNGTIVDIRESKFLRGLPLIEKYFGVDLKLNDDFDLELNGRHDFNVVAGFANAMQAIAIKLNLEKGGIPAFPELGIGLRIGEKSTNAVQEIIEDINTAVAQDRRFSGVESLNVERNGSQLFLDIRVKPAQLDIPVPVRMALT